MRKSDKEKLFEKIEFLVDEYSKQNDGRVPKYVVLSNSDKKTMNRVMRSDLFKNADVGGFLREVKFRGIKVVTLRDETVVFE